MKVRTKKKIVTLILIIVLVVAIICATVFVLDIIYKDKFYPGVKIVQANIGGLDKEQTRKIFNSKINELNTNGQEFFWRSKTITLYPTTLSSTDPDLVYEIISFDLEKTLDKAYNLGRGQNFLDSIWQKFKLIFINKKIPIAYTFDKTEIEKILKNNFSELERPGNNPQINFVENEIEISDGKTGLVFNYNEVIQNLKNNLQNLNFKPIRLELTLDQPEFHKSATQFLIDDIEEVVNLAPLTISATTTNAYNHSVKKSWQVYAEQIKDWLDFKYDKKNYEPILSFNVNKVENWLETLKAQVDKPLKEAKFKLTNNRVTEFQASQKGQELIIQESLDNLIQDITQDRKKQSWLAVETLEPKSQTNSTNNLGIQELIGVGASNFSGSPVNRRHNIKVGADSLNGLLIESGEEFSLNQALGKITAAKGYLPELVIKGNETIPEYGGGLCQIATTMFRLAINSGLEITARKPHAYRVTYYEPAGTDATIYSPWPDLRFINNTPKSLLLQTRVIENDVIFEFWGTSDGRQIATTSPEIYNIVAPGPTKYIETTELAPEKVRCTEIAHYGADAHFIRIISYPDDPEKESTEETFFSHYKPWQAVCLVGVDPSKMASSTEVVE